MATAPRTAGVLTSKPARRDGRLIAVAFIAVPLLLIVGAIVIAWWLFASGRIYVGG